MIATSRKVYLVRREHGRKTLALTAPTSLPTTRTPRISKLVALAVRFDRLLREGKVESLSELARLAHVSQPRATQILNLSLLAPDIIEQLLFLAPVAEGRDAIHERLLRPLSAAVGWAEQRELWRRLVAARAAPSAASRRRPPRRTS